MTCTYNAANHKTRTESDGKYLHLVSARRTRISFFSRQRRHRNLHRLVYRCCNHYTLRQRPPLTAMVVLAYNKTAMAVHVQVFGLGDAFVIDEQSQEMATVRRKLVKRSGCISEGIIEEFHREVVNTTHLTKPIIKSFSQEFLIFFCPRVILTHRALGQSGNTV